jgi:tripartite-type tricarboxylate transporter receptor subunit TctC
VQSPVGSWRWVVFTLAITSAAAPGLGQSQAYPSKPVRLIVPLAPGGGADTFGRFLARQLTDSLGQQVIVDNRPGGGGLIGGEYVARALPDGYTLIVGGSGQLAVSLTHRRLNIERDFTPIALAMDQQFLLVAHPSLPVRSVAELIKLAKSRPGDLIYASAGTGSAGHLAMELFVTTAGIQLLHIPYKGAGAAMADVLAGQVPLIFSSPLGTMPIVKSGRLRALAVSGARRTVALPELPTVAESGLPGFETSSFLGLLGPAGLPADIVKRLSTEVLGIIQRPETREWLLRLGAEPAPGSADQFAARIRSDLERLDKLIRTINLKLG